MARMTKQKAIERLERQIRRAEGLLRQPYNSKDFTKEFVLWDHDTTVTLEYIFGGESRQSKLFSRITYTPTDYEDTPLSDWAKAYRGGLREAQYWLYSMIDEIQDYWDDDMAPTSSNTAEQNEDTPSRPKTRKVFIVHGHDEALKSQVARFLERLDLIPVILQEQPDKGQTIIEKVHDYAGVSFAIALFTPDDLGESVTKVKILEDLKPRARQNVVFELGYFIGRLGRTKAVVLVKKGVERLSDIDGVLYIPADDEATWQKLLFRELKAAKFDIDANRVF